MPRKGRTTRKRTDPERQVGPFTSARPPSLEPARHFPIVGVGASAGGLEAFIALLRGLPVDTGMALVLVPHLAPSHPSALADILSRATSMPVTEVVDGLMVEPNHVYVIPPGRDMTCAGGALHLQPRAVRAHPQAIDLFLESLARDQKHQAVGVVLSGTAADGTRGLQAIKAEGGITFAQDDTAQQSGMPQSAIAGGSVDFVMAPAAIAEELTRISRHPLLPDSAPPIDTDAAHLREVLRIVQRESGVDFSPYKISMLRRRITRRMILQRIRSLEEYASIVGKTPTEALALHQDLLIGVTGFFRDPEAFDALARVVFPRFLTDDRARDPVRIWVPGCSTGQESYSLAMALSQYADASNRRVPIQIFATDVNASAIETARAGVYTREIVESVAPERLRRYFVPVDGHYRIVKSIRELCVFSRHNVLADPPFSRIDLASCRNLLMYLEAAAQRQVIALLHYALRPSGVLWLGSADSVGAQHDLFDTADDRYRIFTKKAGSSHLPAPPAPRQRPGPGASRRDAGRQPDRADLLKESDRLLLARFAPAGVLVSPNLEILQYRGDVGAYLAPEPGRASLDLMKMLDRGLQVAVRAALSKAERDDAVVRETGIRVPSSTGGVRTIAVEVMPVRTGTGGFLVLFDEVVRAASTSRGRPSHAKGMTARDAAAQELVRVSKDLDDTVAYLRSVIEEREAANEELQSAHEEVQSANEELQSINEELETSKEEIQSANEELSTVNEELKHRNVELHRTNDDLMNLVSSAHFAVLFVASDLRIRRYTPMAASLLGLGPSDVNRPIGDLRLKLIAAAQPLLSSTIAEQAIGEVEAQDEQGRWFSIRVQSYRTLDNQVDGAVVVIMDVDALKRARLYAESVIETVRGALLVLDGDLRVLSTNAAYLHMSGTARSCTEGRLFFELEDRRWDVPSLRHLLENVLPTDHVINDVEVEQVDEDGGRRFFLLNASRLVQAAAAAAAAARPLIVLAIEDVTEREYVDTLRRERIVELATADQHKNEFLAMLAHELRNPLAPMRTAVEILSEPGVPAPEAGRARVVIDRQLRHMTRLVDDLLDVARITQGKIDVRLGPTDLTALLRRALEVVEPEARERQQQLLVSLPSEPCDVLGDAIRLEQVFGNLLNNASKFSRKGGRIWLSVEKAEAPGHPGEVMVRIRDEGIGIAPGMQPHIFDLFKQGSHASHRAAGLGVGLALVRRVIELHGGRVSVESAGEDQGTEFVVTLPLAPEATSPEAEGTSGVSPRVDVARHRVLVVDDNVDAAESLAVLLRLKGHETRVAHDGLAALEIATTFRPTVVLLDLAMPSMDGYQVARALRGIPGLELVYIVAVTGFGRDEDRRRSVEAGLDRHMTKPLDLASLDELLAAPHRETYKAR